MGLSFCVNLCLLVLSVSNLPEQGLSYSNNIFFYNRIKANKNCNYVISSLGIENDLECLIHVNSTCNVGEQRFDYSHQLYPWKMFSV